MCNLYVISNVVKRASSVCNRNQTHEVEKLMKRSLKIMNLTYFHPKRRGIVENKTSSPVNIKCVATSGIL